MIRLSRLTPELRAVLASRQFAPTSEQWAEAGRLGLAYLAVRTPERPHARWSLTDEGCSVRLHLLAEPGGTVV
jgi:hypothetical protein